MADTSWFQHIEPLEHFLRSVNDFHVAPACRSDGWFGRLSQTQQAAIGDGVNTRDRTSSRRVGHQCARTQKTPKSLLGICGFSVAAYRRRNQKTRNSYVAMLFGTVTLWRRGYRGWEISEDSIFAMEMLLGLTEGKSQPGLRIEGSRNSNVSIVAFIAFRRYTSLET